MDQDPDLEVRGYVMTKSGTLPTDPRFLALSQNDELLGWTYRCYRRAEENTLVSLMQALGVLWTRADVERMINGKGRGGSPEELMIPLALAINPELRDSLEKMFGVSKGKLIGGGEYQARPTEEVVNLGDLPPEEFIKWANRATGTLKNIAQTREEKAVTSKAGEDPRLDKIREQIRASKRLR